MDNFIDVYSEEFGKPKRKSNSESVTNPKLRALFCSAFLRCILAVLKSNDKDKNAIIIQEKLLNLLRNLELINLKNYIERLIIRIQLY